MQNPNISMFVTLDVFKYSNPSMEVKFCILRNQLKQVVGRASAKEGSNTTFTIELDKVLVHSG